jgi:hypothetical protein
MIQTVCQVRAVYTGDNSTPVGREQFCEYTISPVTREHAIMEVVFSVRSVPRLIESVESFSI